jgi:hypothetical protein
MNQIPYGNSIVSQQGAWHLAAVFHETTLPVLGAFNALAFPVGTFN